MASRCSPAAPRRSAASETTPVIALPGAPDQALAAWWTLALPVLDRLSGRRPRKTVTLPLARKIASSVGIAEIVLLERKQGAWIAAGGRRPVARCHRPRRCLAGGARRQRRALRRARAVDAYMLRE